MSKNKHRNKKPSVAEIGMPGDTAKVEDVKKPKPLITFYGFRELVESIAIAFILAFLFRTFEAEAFVIPTGSMATTLMGRHKDLVCDKCGYQFQVSASEEVDSRSEHPTGKVVVGGVCPMCRHPMELSPRSLKEKDHRSFNGDRIIVGKFMYQFEEPSRWDVSVFKFPADSKTNFIKRLVGLPNETLRISRGDLYTKPKDAKEFSIARKPPNKQLAMMQIVYDNDYVLPGMLEKGWPARWQDRNKNNGWKSSSDRREFSISGKQSQTSWLEYRHFVPEPSDWHELSKGPLPKGYKVKPQLIADFNPYNTGIWRDAKTGMGSNGGRGYGMHWVGDLAVQCNVEVESDSGEILFKLIEGGRDMLCTIDVATGKAVLTISGESFQRTAQTPVSKPGEYKIMFSNVDDQLRLWVNGDLVDLDKLGTYEPLDNKRPQESDLAPVGIGSRGVKMRAAHLKVFRDIYYIADKTGNGMGVSDYEAPFNAFGLNTPNSLADFLSDPKYWDVFDSDKMRSVEFALDEDQFLMLGDNSAMSRDSRLWNPNEYYVDRDLLIGKALYIYWPHSWDKLPGTNVPFPFFPNVKEMQFVR